MEDLNYNQKCRKGEQEEKSPQAAFARVAKKQHIHPRCARCCCCPGMGLQVCGGVVSRWQWLGGGAQRKVGGKEERPSCQNVLPWLCSQ